MKYRIIMDKHAMKNDKAHRRLGLEFDQADDLSKNSPALVGELRMIHMCSQSDGACAMIFASEEKAKKLCRQPAWIKDHVTVHREELFCIFGGVPYLTTHKYAAQKLYERNGIKDPRREIDMFEMYDPSSWWGLDWLREFLLLENDEHIRMVENDEITMDGSFPVNPSGGVIASNPIGATAMIRIAEAALQIMGEAGDHQVTKPVNQAMASGFGGTMWTVLFLLTKEVPW
jgi:acetyl-CoA C-acetyltransferase